MSLRTEIKKAITHNSRYTAIRVWVIDVTEDHLDEDMRTMRIEVAVRKKRKVKGKKSKGVTERYNFFGIE